MPRVVPLVLGGAVGLTLLFTAQDAIRRAANGAPVNWAHTFALNALDWVVWAALLPFVIAAGRRIRLGSGPHRVARAAGWLALALAYVAAQSIVTGLVIRFTSAQFFGLTGPGPGGGPSARPLGAFLWSWGLATSSLNLLVFGMTMGALHATLYYRDLRVRQLREADLRARLARAELNSLQTQLQPHFLFNALHTVSSLMVSDVAAAQSVVSALGDLLRVSLDHTARQEIPLRDEVAFVGRYLEVQRARFRSRLVVEIAVPDGLLDALVPSLVLQPLVETAIRHAIEPSAAGGRIRISAARRADELTLVVRNDGVVQSDAPAASGGIGLTNLEARLRQLYGPSHEFRAGSSDGEFVVSLTLPWHTGATRGEPVAVA
jgi:two-component system, LytTR family, sensor kinase